VQYLCKHLTIQGASLTTEATTPAPAKVRRPPYPVITPETAPFWESVNEGALRLSFCNAGDGFFFPPANFCPVCWREEVTFEPVAGTGKVFSFVTFRRLYNPAFSDLLPYSDAVIELDEGPRLLSRIVGPGDNPALVIGAPVHVVYEPLDGDTYLPLFALDGEDSEEEGN
jgi:uncharacterized OB-fold protein